MPFLGVNCLHLFWSSFGIHPFSLLLKLQPNWELTPIEHYNNLMSWMALLSIPHLQCPSCLQTIPMEIFLLPLYATFMIHTSLYTKLDPASQLLLFLCWKIHCQVHQHTSTWNSNHFWWIYHWPFSSLDTAMSILLWRRRSHPHILYFHSLVLLELREDDAGCVDTRYSILPGKQIHLPKIPFAMAQWTDHLCNVCSWH